MAAGFDASGAPLRYVVLEPKATTIELKKFPPELRTMVWDEALLEESNSRDVVYDGRTGIVSPDRGILSPLLTTSYESRVAAQEFYACRLPVVTQTRNRLEDLTWEMRLGTLGADRAPGAHTQGRREGVLYVNLDRDRFVTGVKASDTCTHKHDGRYWFNDDGSHWWPALFPYNHVTGRALTPDERERIDAKMRTCDIQALRAVGQRLLVMDSRAPGAWEGPYEDRGVLQSADQGSLERQRELNRAIHLLGNLLS